MNTGKKNIRRGILYIVSTPIGNLEDITLRALRVLKEVRLIAAEDTRRTAKLTAAFAVETPLTSLHEWNESRKTEYVLSRLEEGEDVAYVTDAGTPGVSDPGFVLVREALAGGYTVVPVPGVTAAVAALSIAGLPMDSYVFFAFLPAREGKKRKFLESIRDEEKTMVFYESPRRLEETLRMMAGIFGDRPAVVARELTKMHEETIRGTIAEVLDRIAVREIRGEVTLIVGGKERGAPEISEEGLADLYLRLRKDPSLSTRDIAGIISRRTGLPKKQVYSFILKKENRS
ncbi:MAG: 16S rRNA (cytidine(1402)-2'-O)-methyltransferase [Syntrophales bacterium]|nr:16S rRNA (cytidine(1402)-2'-O)-methyltransferase [Syntrophales bacterium]MDD5234308.1 16S rRNA (cytidine(1402)-2'-O)-methyltransferase [Syntrophales bacterium]MDD5532484.1 16S rRNA (cytidine(1402)-2'-O)-methyltransferase [Syntrophales bacterium]